MSIGMGRKKSIVPNQPEQTIALNSSPLPEWMSGEAPQLPPKKKKPRIDSGGQLVRGSMRAA